MAVIGLSRFVPTVNGFPGERILDVLGEVRDAFGIFGEEFPAPRAQQFVEANLHLKGWDLELDEQLVVRGAYEGVGLAGVGGTDHVAKRHVLIH